MIDARILAFTAAAGLVVITPGSDTILVIRNTSTRGRLAGIVTTCGICLGLFVHAILSALGLSVILMQSAVAFHIVKILGALYLIWLGSKSLYSSYQNRGKIEIKTRRQQIQKNSFIEGFLSNVLNPKVAFFYLSFLPQFIDPKYSVLLQSILLAGIHYVLAMAWLLSITMAVGTFRSALYQTSFRRWMEGISGVVLIVLGLILAAEKL